jgi:hypothetical protein
MAFLLEISFYSGECRQYRKEIMEAEATGVKMIRDSRLKTNQDLVFNVECRRPPDGVWDDAVGE